MAAVLRPFDTGILPNRLGHGRRHDGVVAGGKGKDGAGQLVFSLSRIPMHQPIEAFAEACDVERLRQGKARSAAGPGAPVEGGSAEAVGSRRGRCARR